MAGLDDTLKAPVSRSTSSEAFAPGSVLAGRYRIERFIASGGAGEVYEATDLVLRATIALKTLRATSTEAVERMRREIALARKVTHPNICRVHDLGEHDGRVFLTMELLAGRTLADRIASGSLDMAEVERIARQLVAALAALHGAGVIHRDLKSANVVLVEDGRAVVTDFGLARTTERGDAGITGEATLLGTPAYMAPEQVLGREVTPASDIYALGVVLFEMATGARPFTGDTPMEVATARLHGAAPRASSVRPSVDARWDAIIERCLERDPGRRFERVEDIVAARAPRTRRGLLAAAVVVLLAGGAGAWLAIARTNEPSAPQIEPRDRAVAHLRRWEWNAAREILEPLVARAPDDAWLHHLFARAAGHMPARSDGEEVASKHARIAYEKRAALSPADQLRIEVHFLLLSNDTDGALAASERLLAANDLDMDDLLVHAELLWRMRRLDDARAVLARLRTLAPADPRSDLLEAVFAENEDLRRAQLHAQRALVFAILARAPLLQAHALDTVAFSLWQSGEFAHAARQIEAARARFAAAADRRGLASTHDSMALLQTGRGELRAALASWQAAVDTSPRMPGVPYHRARLAFAHARVGDLAAAEALLSAPDLVSAGQLFRGWLAELRGDFSLARRELEIVRNERLAASLQRIHAAWRLGVACLRGGDLKSARRELEAARQGARVYGSSALLVQVRIALAELALAEGDPAQAELEARHAIAWLRAHGSTSELGFAYAASIAARRELGDVPGLQAALREAEVIRGRLEDLHEANALVRAIESVR